MLGALPRTVMSEEEIRAGVMVARKENVTRPFSYRAEGGDDDDATGGLAGLVGERSGEEGLSRARHADVEDAAQLRLGKLHRTGLQRNGHVPLSFASG